GCFLLLLCRAMPGLYWNCHFPVKVNLASAPGLTLRLLAGSGPFVPPRTCPEIGCPSSSRRASSATLPAWPHRAGSALPRRSAAPVRFLRSLETPLFSWQVLLCHL